MSAIVSIIITLIIMVAALKIALKVTGCFIRLIIFGVALYFIMMVLNFGFHILSFIF